MRYLYLLSILACAALLACGQEQAPTASGPAGKASADCTLAEIFSGKEGCQADPSLDEVPAGYVPPVDSTAVAVEDTLAAGDAGDGNGEPVEEEPVEEVEEPVVEEPVVEEPVVTRTPSEARAELDRLGISYTEAAFLDSAGSGNLEVVKLFVEAGMWANVTAMTKSAWDGLGDRTALHVAAANGHLSVVEYLVGQGASLTAKSKNENGVTALYYAARSRHWEIVKYLVENGANVNARTNDGQTALHEAARSRHWEIVKYLVENGANDVRPNNGYTALYYAARSRHWEIVKYLVENGANVNVRTNRGYTVLRLAARGGRLSEVKYLVENGADVNTRDNYVYYTVLHEAAGYGHLSEVKYLVENGADVNATTKGGRTTLDTAACRGYRDVARYLRSVGAKRDRACSGGGDGDDDDDDGGGGGGACSLGQVVRPGESCGAGGGSFRNVGDGCFVYTPFGSGKFCVSSFNVNGLRGTRSGNNFTITGLP